MYLKLKNQFIILLFIAAATISCNDDDAVPSIKIIDIKIENPAAQYFADGTSTITIVADLPKNASESKRSVTFTTTNGIFSENNKQEIVVEAKVVDNNLDRLFAEVDLKAPISPDSAVVKGIIQDVTSAPVEIVFEKANASSVKLSIDTAGIPADYSREAFLEGSLRSATGLPSLNAMVLFSVFEDSLGNGVFKKNPVDNPIFRSLDQTSNTSGKVSAFFNGGNLAQGRIKIECEIVDELGAPTGIVDSVFLQLY